MDSQVLLINLLESQVGVDKIIKWLQIQTSMDKLIKPQNQIGGSVAFIHRLPSIQAVSPSSSNGHSLHSDESFKTNIKLSIGIGYWYVEFPL